MAIDLLDPDAVARITAQTADIEVGLLIYNAGANTCSEPFLDAELSDFGRVIDLNVTRMLQLVQHFARPMRSRGRGGILVVGSMAATHGSMRQSVYTGVKAFSRLFAESLWLELREHGVDVLELVLGVTRTPAMARAGLNFDVPGLSVSEPADVAREGLENLANGPVFIAGGNAAAVHRGSGPTAPRSCWARTEPCRNSWAGNDALGETGRRSAVIDADELLTRLCRLEDERDIARLIASYGPAVDAGTPTPRRGSGRPMAATTSRVGRCTAGPTCATWSARPPIRSWWVVVAATSSDRRS